VLALVIYYCNVVSSPGDKARMVTKSESMNVETKIFLALGLDKAHTIRKIAATVAYRYWMEMHRFGWFKSNQDKLTKLVKRFRLGDWICALSAHYPVR